MVRDQGLVPWPVPHSLELLTMQYQLDSVISLKNVARSQILDRSAEHIETLCCQSIQGHKK